MAVLSFFPHAGKNIRGHRGWKIQKFPLVAILTDCQKYISQSLAHREIRHSRHRMSANPNLKKNAKDTPREFKSLALTHTSLYLKAVLEPEA